MSRLAAPIYLGAVALMVLLLLIAWVAPGPLADWRHWHALKRLLATRSHVVGVLLTKYDAKAGGHGYQYEGYYAYGGPARLIGNKR